MPYNIRRSLLDHEQSKLSGFSPLLAHLLFHRGIFESVSALKFVEPDYDRDGHDPFLLKDAEKAADRIIKAIKDGEKIAVYADYDADGIPGAVVFNDFFTRIGYKNFLIYIPHRHDEGFGVNIDAVDQIVAEGAKLMITVDCGIADYDAIAHAVAAGMDVIVTDHHEPPLVSNESRKEKLPPAYAVIDHRQADCKYPDKNLCGSAVAFKLIQAVLKKERFGLKLGQEKWLLDMVGIATLSDMVPLVGENRVFAFYGLMVMRKSPRKGLRQLLNKLRISQSNITEDDIAFMITPRINAASRMGVPIDAYRLLSADNDTDARTYAEHIDSINTERKGAVAVLVREVKETLSKRYGTSIPSVIALGNPSWRPALLGLVANSCAEEYGRPVFLWGRSGDNSLKGSCRSEGKTHIVDLMRAVPSGVLTQFGGHKHSGGFVIGSDAVHFLEQRLNEAAQNLSSGGSATVPEQTVDAVMSLEEVTGNLYNDISRLAPFGMGNSRPTFLFKDISANSVRFFGKGKQHLEFIFTKPGGGQLSAIAFFASKQKWANAMIADKKFDLVASLEKSTFGYRTTLRLRVVDIII